MMLRIFVILRMIPMLEEARCILILMKINLEIENLPFFSSNYIFQCLINFLKFMLHFFFVIGRI